MYWNGRQLLREAEAELKEFKQLPLTVLSLSELLEQRAGLERNLRKIDQKIELRYRAPEKFEEPLAKLSKLQRVAFYTAFDYDEKVAVVLRERLAVLNERIDELLGKNPQH